MAHVQENARNITTDEILTSHCGISFHDRRKRDFHKSRVRKHLQLFKVHNKRIFNLLKAVLLVVLMNRYQ